MYNREIIHFNNKTNFSMNYISAQHDNSINSDNYNGIFALSLHRENVNNPISQLYNQKLINLPRYSIHISKNNSKLLIGDYSKEPQLANTNKLINYCNSKDNKCDITGININNKKVNIDSFSVFDTETTSLVIPISDFRLFKRYIFNNTECKFDDGKLACKFDVDYIFPILKIYISGSEFKIDINKLAKVNEKEYNYEFDIIVDTNDFDTWRLGTSVLENSLITYDLQNKKIGFVQDDNISTILSNLNFLEDKEEPSKIGYIVSLGIIILMIFYLVKFALSYRSKSDIFDPYDMNDRNILESLKKKFTSDQYDHDQSFGEPKHDTKIFELKDSNSKSKDIEQVKVDQ